MLYYNIWNRGLLPGSDGWGVTGVNWLRTKAKRLSLLALFALALQLGLSFGHTHANVAVAGISASGSQSQASTPDADHDQDVHRDLCAICATIAMASSLVASGRRRWRYLWPLRRDRSPSFGNLHTRLAARRISLARTSAFLTRIVVQSR
jgi:hypothetical protein